MNIIENSIIKVDNDNCTLCKRCVIDCVARILYIKSGQLQFTEDFEDRCIKCGHCVAVCPMNAIEMKDRDDEFLKGISKTDDFPNFDSLSNLILKRRSIRQFKDTPISKELLENLLQLARYSPTGSNTENVFYTVIQNKDTVAKISEYITEKVKRFTKNLEDPMGRKILQEKLPKLRFDLAIENLPRTKGILKIIEHGTDFWCWDGELIIIHGESDLGALKTNSALAAAHIMLIAKTLGLGTCSLGYLTFHLNESDTLKKLLNLPDNHEIGYSLAIGYPNVKYKRIPPRKALRVHWI